MSKIIQEWMNFIEDLVKEWPEKDINKTWIKVTDKRFDVKEVVEEKIFLVCKYQNPVLKMTQLEAQYLDKHSFEDALANLDSNKIKVSLIGEAKKGTSSTRKHCLKEVVINYPVRVSTLYFRASDIIKKFLTDVFFVQQKVLKPLAALSHEIRCVFETVMLRSPFWFIYLDQYGDLYGEEKLKERIEKFDPITCSWLRYYSRNLDKEINYKSLHRGRDRMEESKWWPIYKKYIIDYKSK